MNLKTWLDKAGIGQRELARRLGYQGNGFVTLVANGKRTIPPDEVPKWAEKLGLSQDDRQAFIEDARASVIPDWVRAEIADLRAKLRILDDIVGTGHQVEVSPKDLALCDGDERRARILSIQRRAYLFCQERIMEAEGNKGRPTINGGKKKP